jgi:hypothetical protein
MRMGGIIIVNRRHMTKGQRAMAVAMISPERQQGKKRTSAETAEGISERRVREARMVLKWAPELAQAVLSGAHPLDRAYDIAADRKTKAEVPEQRRRGLCSNWAEKLQSTSPTMAASRLGACNHAIRHRDSDRRRATAVGREP